MMTYSHSVLAACDTQGFAVRGDVRAGTEKCHKHRSTLIRVPVAWCGLQEETTYKARHSLTSQHTGVAVARLPTCLSSGQL
jgi:hypothetical protein